MYFINGTFAIFAPASALNNGQGSQNRSEVKSVRVARHEYPYVSAQALRFWLRKTLHSHFPEFRFAPVHRADGKKQQAYTEADPITYWDDDLLGYMRAIKNDTLTRISPVRTGTLVSAAPVEVVSDFGVMARAEGDMILHEHEFYRTSFVGHFSIDLNSVGTFTYNNSSGYRNLNKDGCEIAEAEGLEHIPDQAAYRLPIEERIKRVATLLRALGRLEGGANQTLHYTDVSPSMVMMSVCRGAINPYYYIVDQTHQPQLHVPALREALASQANEDLSRLYVGLRAGYSDDMFETFKDHQISPLTPKQAFDELADDLSMYRKYFL